MQQIDSTATNLAFERDSDEILKWVRRLQLGRFHGKFIINFQNGVVGDYNKQESILPVHRQKQAGSE